MHVPQFGDRYAMPEPDYEDPKEVWAFCGLAMYFAQVLEQSLVNLAVVVRADQRGCGLTRREIDAMFDGYAKWTFGQVLADARRMTAIPAELDGLIAHALKRRNYLAHEFFVEHDRDILFEDGRRKMIDELRADAKFFQDLDERMEPICADMMAKHGVTSEILEGIYNAMLAGTWQRPATQQMLDASAQLDDVLASRS